MNKLQLYIYKSLRGFKNIRNINPSETVQSHIRDARPALELLQYDTAEKQLFFLLQYIDGGCLFTILRTIPDGIGDHLASIIFVPNGMDIKASQLAEVVNHTVRIVSNPAVSADDMTALQDLFSREYPRIDSPAAMAGSLGREFGVARYGGSTGRSLNHYFDDRLYQTEYLPYAGVLLVDDDLGVDFDCDDLTDIPLATPVELTPPEGDNDGFTPHIFRHVFDRPFLASQGTEVDIVWTRQGFEDKVQTIAVDTDDLSLEAISADDARKTIAPSSFYITAAPGNRTVDDAEITVNGIAITQPVTFTLAQLREAEVEIKATGYIPYHNRLDLGATTRVLVRLQEQPKVFRFELPVKSTELGSPIHFEIHTKRDLTESPIEGYTLLDKMQEGRSRTNYLQFTGGSKMPGRRSIIIGVALLIGGIIAGWALGSATSCSRSAEAAGTDSIEAVAPPVDAPKIKKAAEKSNNKPDNKSVEKAADPAVRPAAKAADKAAIAYLESNSTWTREGMSKHPDLAGLFDDLNHYRFEAITGKWADALSKSERFTKVATHASESMRKKIFEPSGTYCPEGDNAIAVQSYLFKIDPAKKAKK